MYWVKKLSRYAIFVSFFSVWPFSVLHGHSVFSSPQQLPMISEVKGFLSQILSITILSYLSSWVRASISLLILSAKQGNLTGTIFITSLVWRGPWLGIEPGTSRTPCQHSTTRLSRRRYLIYMTTLLLFAFSHFHIFRFLHITSPGHTIYICLLLMTSCICLLVSCTKYHNELNRFTLCESIGYWVEC